MKVCLATQVFSHSAAAALRTYGAFNIIKGAEGTAEFLEVN